MYTDVNVNISDSQKQKVKISISCMNPVVSTSFSRRPSR